MSIFGFACYFFSFVSIFFSFLLDRIISSLDFLIEVECYRFYNLFSEPF